jgi:hypothetical protein
MNKKYYLPFTVSIAVLLLTCSNDDFYGTTYVVERSPLYPEVYRIEKRDSFNTGVVVKKDSVLSEDSTLSLEQVKKIISSAYATRIGDSYYIYDGSMIRLSYDGEDE